MTRFAPSPTGYLHLGHVVNAIHVWGIARALGGRVLLRIEDHDRIRSRPGFERAILEDLEWLGFVADAGPVRQRDRGERYQRACAALTAAGLVYACDCSRRELGGPPTPGREQPYPGRCRTRGLERNASTGLRVRLLEGVETFDDGRLGLRTQEPSAQCGDVLIRDRDGNWTYQFAVTVDDLEDGIDLVIRGEDLLESTGRQLRLARLLGRAAPPVYWHHPLLLKPAGTKLSKSDGDTGVRELRAAGHTPQSVIGRAAALGGLLEVECELDAREAGRLFS